MVYSIFKSCIFCAVLHFIFCGKGSLDDGVHVIRIHNNGSQIRTIYLPNYSSNSSFKTLKYYKKSSNPLNGHKFIQVNGFGKHNYIKEKPYQMSKFNTDSYDGISDDTISLKGKVERPALNLSGQHQEQFSTKKRKEIPSKNNVIPTKKSGIEIKVSADKIAKVLNIFTIVNFSNELCYAEEGVMGVCYHPSECQHLGGKPHGPCAQGFGVCCFIARTCDGSSAINNTYFTSSGISQNTDSGVYVCTVIIYKSNPDVIQLRLYLENFQLAGPVDGNCVVDRFVVTGQNRDDIIPPICGYNSGKHVYIDVDDVEGPVSLTLLSSGAQGAPRDLRIRVSQLTRDHPLVAPKNCLQYFTEPLGSIESFNYIPPNNTSTSTPGYFNNLNYAICFKKSDGLCGVVYSNVADEGMKYTFEIVNKESDGTSVVTEGQAGAESFDCPDDFISTSSLRLCGYKLNDGSSTVDYTKNSPVMDDSNGPLVLRFRTNGNVTGRGFHLDYMMSPCLPGPGLGGGTGTPTGSPLPPAVTRAPLLA